MITSLSSRPAVSTGQGNNGTEKVNLDVCKKGMQADGGSGAILLTLADTRHIYLSNDKATP